MLLQMNLSLGVLDAKRRDNELDCRNAKSLLRKYYGSKPACNVKYANRIFKCALCIKRGDNQVSKKCLEKALGGKC